MTATVSPSSGTVERFFQFSLLGLLTSGYLAVLGSGFLDAPTAVFAAMGLLLRLLLVTGLVQFEFSQRWVTAATLAYIGFYPLDYQFVSRDFVTATVHLIFFLAVIRVLTARTNRDYFFVKVIACLELLAATMLSSSMNFVLFLVLFVIFGVATFCCSEIRRSTQSGGHIVGGTHRFHWRLAVLTSSVTLGILVMTAGLFFLLPRTARAALKNLVPARYHLTGFSTQVMLGATGELKQQSTPVMHVRLEPPFEQANLKWRGAALSVFDGTRWYNAPDRAESIRVENDRVMLTPGMRPARSRRLSYEVSVNSFGTSSLFFAGIPEAIHINSPWLFRGAGDSYRTRYAVDVGNFSYMVSAYRDEEGSAVPRRAIPAQTYLEHLTLPKLDPRIAALAKQVAGDGTQAARAQRIEEHLRSRYAYTTQLLSEPVADPLAHFLFDRRQGHCEYFASAMAVMLRTIHIPARVATGFQGGLYNPLTGWQLVRASDAHSWVEAYLPETGWTTFDPTPADRSANANGGLFNQLALYLDAADTFWQQWVMNYDIERQVSLASHLDRSRSLLDGSWFKSTVEPMQSWLRAGRDQAAPYAGGGVALVVLATGLVMYGPRGWKVLLGAWRVRRLRMGVIASSDAAVLYARMLDILRRRGYEKPAWLTPAEFARILPSPEYASIVGRITASYHELRYAQDNAAGVRMLEQIKELESLR